LTQASETGDWFFVVLFPDTFPTSSTTTTTTTTATPLIGTTKAMNSPPGAIAPAQDTTTHNTESDDDKELNDYLVPETLSRIPDWLLPCHLVSAVFHYLQAFILFSFAGRDQTKWPIYTNFPSQDDFNPDFYGVPLAEQSGTLSVTLLGAMYLLFSAFYHTCAIIPCGRYQYEWYLRRSQSPFRWVDHCISEGLMKMVIAILAGVSDAHLLFSIFVLVSNGVIFNFVHEQLNAKARCDGYQQVNTSFYMSFVPLLCTWIVILVYQAGASSSDTTTVPKYVGATIILMLLFDIIFILLFILQWRQYNVFEDYAFGEFCFILLSFTRKTFLAWISYGAATTGY
jgi:hypothetical protein